MRQGLLGFVLGAAMVALLWSDLGGDPAVGQPKTLRVEYTFGGRTYVRTAKDAQWITIP